jgi:hypothetical protein
LAIESLLQKREAPGYFLMLKKSPRTYSARRKVSLRRDASVATAVLTIETTVALPKGSVQLVLPKGRRARGDKRIEALLIDWGWFD